MDFLILFIQMFLDRHLRFAGNEVGIQGDRPRRAIVYIQEKHCKKHRPRRGT